MSNTIGLPFERYIKSLENRIKFLEDHVRELVYLAQCNGWNFGHIERTEDSPIFGAKKNEPE